VVIVYDADAAGIRAALRGVGLLTDAGLTVRAMALPDGKDPDDFIRAHGADAFRDLVNGALDFVTFYVRMSPDRLDTIEGRTTVAREIFTILASLNDELRRDEYLKRAARELNLHEWVCQGEFMKFLRDAAGRTTPTAVRTAPTTAVTQDDRDFIAALLGSPDLLERAKEELAGTAFVPSVFVEVMSALFESTGPDVTQRLTTDEARNLYSAAAIEQLDVPEKAMEIVDKRITRLKRDSLKAKADSVQRELSEAEQVRDFTRVRELLQLKAGINRQIENVGVS